jgi:acylphosphatase
MIASNEAQAFRFSVSGIVQGVGFRYWAIHQAESLSLSGWVCNEADGSVSGFAQGKSQELDSFASWLKHGPSSAQVNSCEIEKAEVNPTLKGFAAKYGEFAE